MKQEGNIKLISEEEALNMLNYGGRKEIENNIEIFDEYGNYSFPTDIKLDVPNVAVNLGLIIK
ncbi:MAG: hypothetical protein SO007_01120 [Candidatus Enteromonas sp.]|nr:hypothetical protein [Candidatus Enteromonas sp.]